MAPEICRGEMYSKASDTFAYGVIMWELIHPGLKPFHKYDVLQLKELYEKSTQPQVKLPQLQIEKTSIPVDAKYIELMQQCLKFNALERPTMQFVVDALKTMQS